MQQTQVATPPMGATTGWGLGWALRSLQNGEREIGHGGGTHGQVSMLEVVPDRRLAVVVLANSVTGAGAAERVVEHVLTSLAGAGLAQEADNGADDLTFDLELYGGSYGLGPLRLDVAAEEGQLVVTPSITPTPPVAPPPMRLSPLSREAFVVPGSPAGARSTVRFTGFDTDGRPAYLFNGQPRHTNRAEVPTT